MGLSQQKRSLVVVEEHFFPGGIRGKFRGESLENSVEFLKISRGEFLKPTKVWRNKKIRGEF